MLKSEFRYSGILFFLLLVILSFDFLNGIVIIVLGSDLKLTYIKIILTLLCFMLLLTDRMLSIVPIILILLTIIFVFVHSHVSDDYNVVEDVSNFIKLLMPMIIFMSFYTLNKRGYFQQHLIIKYLNYFFKSAMVFIFINSCLIMYGVSIYQYQFSDTSAGGGGLISSGNELAALLVLLYLPSLSFFSKSTTNKLWLVSCFLVYGFAMFVGGMKFAILSFIILTFYYLFYVQQFNVKSTFYGLLVITILPLVFGRLFQLIEPFISRWEYFYSKFDLLTFLLSGRNVRVDYFFNQVMSNISLKEFLFGFGWGTDDNIAFIGYGVYEVDLFDALYSYGLIGVIISFFIWGGAFTISIVNLFKAKNLFVKSISLSVVLLFSGSFVTGHIWFSGLIGIYLGMLFFFSLMLRNETNESFSFY